jgi:alkylation response protein AidB-like acyl-CoA dehydrogenase
MPCDLNRSDDQRQILDAVGSVLQSDYPVSRLRAEGQDDLGPIAALGILGLALPEDVGGVGLTAVEEMLVHNLLGQHVISPRVLASALGARLAAQCGLAEIAQSLISGGRSACAGIPSGDWTMLVDTAGADLVLVFDAGGLTLLDIQNAPREKLDGLGHGLSIERCHLDTRNGIARVTDSTVRAVADLLISAQLLGVADAARDLAVSYAKIREQFGRPIGSFQAIKHHCANMAVSCAVLSAQLDMAAIGLRDARADAEFQVAALARLAPRLALENARTCIQVHGGIGFSAEADAHHYLKHAHVLRQLLGGAALLELPAPLAPHAAAPEVR